MELDKSLPWEKVAEPQSDFVDLDLIWYVAEELYQYKKKEQLSEITLLDRIAINFNCNNEKKIKKEDYISNDLNLLLENILKNTPYSEHISRFLDVYYPYFRNQDPDSYDFEKTGHVLGCSCGPKSFPINGSIEVCSTYMNPISAGDGIVHEVWHQRLHALGIDFETHAGLFFTNSDEEVFDSPIRKDKLRPMPAVIQAQYSYIGVTEYYKTLIDSLFRDNPSQNEKINTPNIHSANLDSWLRASARNVYRIREGVETINSNIKPTPDIGERFMFGYMSYANRVINEAIDQLKYYENRFNVKYDWGERL